MTSWGQAVTYRGLRSVIQSNANRGIGKHLGYKRAKRPIGVTGTVLKEYIGLKDGSWPPIHFIPGSTKGTGNRPLPLRSSVPGPATATLGIQREEGVWLVCDMLLGWLLEDCYCLLRPGCSNVCWGPDHPLNCTGISRDRGQKVMEDAYSEVSVMWP